MFYDLHNDMFTGLEVSEYRRYLESVRGRKIILVIWTTRLYGIGQGFFRRTVSGLERGSEHGYAIEDLHFLDKCPLSILSEIPLRYVGLTWNGDNSLAGGAHGNGELTLLGKQTLETADRLDIAVDTAHLNRKSFYQVLEHSKGRVLNSHCCFDSVFAHPRNLTDEQIGALIERGGIVGMCLESSFLSGGESSVSDVVRHIDYFVQKFGCDNLAVGTDFNGCSPPKDLCDYAALEAVLPSELYKLGYNETTVKKIFSENAEGYFDKTKANS